MAPKQRSRRTRRAFGGIRQLPSGRWQANYTGPDARIHKAPNTFSTKLLAEGWLANERKLIELDTWTSPETRKQHQHAQTATDFGTYAARWVANRQLKPRTRLGYEALLRNHLTPAFGSTPLDAISPDQVREWYSGLDARYVTRNRHAYALFHAILATAVTEDQLIDRNPCMVRGAMAMSSKRDLKVLTPAHIKALAAAMPPEVALSVLLMGWCGLRRGELFELRRGDVEFGSTLGDSCIDIRRAVTERNGTFFVTRPKTKGSEREVWVPPHVDAELRAHVGRIGTDPKALLFPDPVTGGHMREWSYRKQFDKAREAIGRPDLRVHDLRHCAGVLASLSGGSLVEVMNRLGHSTQSAALRYQHVADGRDAAIAQALSKLAAGAPELT